MGGCHGVSRTWLKREERQASNADPGWRLLTRMAVQRWGQDLWNSEASSGGVCTECRRVLPSTCIGQEDGTVESKPLRLIPNRARRASTAPTASTASTASASLSVASAIASTGVERSVDHPNACIPLSPVYLPSPQPHPRSRPTRNSCSRRRPLLTPVLAPSPS